MTTKQKQAGKAATKRNSETRQAPKKIVTRRSRSEAQAERELTKHLTKVNNQQRAQLRSRRTAPLTTEKPATRTQREKIQKLGEDLGLTYAALHGRLRRAKTYTAAKALIERMTKQAAKRDAEVSQLELDAPDDHEWLRDYDHTTSLTPEEVKALDRDIERVKWVAIGGFAAIAIFFLGWFARGA